MKKSLVALAVLAASGAAMAQSSVTMYGIADIWFGTLKNENNATSPVGALSQTLLNSGGVNGSRWGLKGSEDLGGGLKANFVLEQGFSLDSGAVAAINGTATAAFARQSWVGFSGDFGAIRLGRTTVAYDEADGLSAAVLFSALDPSRNVFRSHSSANTISPAGGALSRPDNTIFYQAPNLSGFTGAISYSLGEDKTALVGATSITSMNLTYAGGPLAAQFGYQSQDIANTVALPSDKKFMYLAASYNLGSIVPKASFGKATNVGNQNGADTTDYQVGVDYVASSTLVLSGSFARSSDNLAAGDFTRKGYGLGAKYILSKRTFLYGGYESDTTTKTAVADAKHSVMAVGVQHRF